MKHMRATNRVAAMLTAVALTVMVSGCGSDSAASGSSSSGGSGDPIMIGSAVPLSGPLASNNSQLSMEYAAKEINDKGGVGGRQIKLVVEDSGATAATGVTAANKFVQDKVSSVVGFTTTTQNLAVSPIFQKAKLINLTGTASTANDFDETKNPYTFNFNIPDNETAKNQVDFALNDLKAKKVALILDSSAFGQTYGSLVTPLIEQGGGQVVAQESVNPDANDLSSQVTKIVAADPDVIMVALLTPPTVTLMFNEIVKQNAKSIPMIGAAATVATFGKSVPWETASGVYGTFMTDGMYDPANVPVAMKSWWDEQHSKGDVPPADTYAQMHDSVLAYASAVEATGGTDPDKISDYFKQLKDFKGWNGIPTLSGPYTCDDQHQCLHIQYMGQVKDQAIVKVRQF